MIRHEQDLKKLLHKYHLDNRIPEDVQQCIMFQSSEQLASILKKTGSYSIYFAALLFIIDKAAKYGIRLSFLQSKIILFFATVTTLGTFSTGGYWVSTKIIAALREPVSMSENSQPVIAPTGEQENNTSHTVEKKKFTFGMPMFRGGSTQSKKATLLLVRNLNRMLGESGATVISLSERNKASKLVYGSLVTTEGKTLLTVKIINVKNAAIEYLITEEVTASNPLEAAVRKIAGQLVIRL